MAPIFKKIEFVWRYPVAIIAIGIAIFITYNTLSAHVEASALKGMYEIDRSSVSFYDGKYHVDSVVIRKELNKKRLIVNLETQTLKQRMKIGEIPDFIWRFLDSISYDKKFDIVNPGEEWKSGITNFGRVVFTKRYDANLKDSVSVLSGDGAVLPNKQLVYFGMSETIALLTYYKGGFGPLPNIIIIKHQDKKIVDFWYGSVFEGNITSKNEIIKSLKSKRKNGC